MDPQKIKEIIDNKSNTTYPLGATKSEKHTIRRRASHFELSGEDLCHVTVKRDGTTTSEKVVSSAEKAQEIFKHFHGSGIGAHSGINKTCDAVAQRYYWPNMYADVRNWVSQCTECQMEKINIKTPLQYTPILVKEPWELVGMDLIGPLASTKNGNQYICTITDYLTKWVEAYPLRSKTAAEVADCIVKLVYRFGASKRILTDHGKEFINELNTALCRLLDIQRSLSSPYHPQTNGLVERMNGTIQLALSKLVNRKPETWDIYLEAVLFGLRTKKQMTTKHSPYFLMFGREARYPLEVPETFDVTQVDVEDLVADEAIAKCLQSHEKVFDLVRENIKKRAEKIKAKNETTNQKLSPIMIGDKVLRRNVRSEQRKGGKLDPSRLGPFTVLKVTGKSVDLENQKGKKIEKVNLDHLQKFKELTEHKLTQTKVCEDKPHTSQSTVIAPSQGEIGTQPIVTPNHPTPVTNLLTENRSEPQSAMQVSSNKPESQLSKGTSTKSVELNKRVLPNADSGTDTSPYQCINDAWNDVTGQILISKIGAYKIWDTDLQCLKPGNELESQVINAYLLSQITKHNIRSAHKACLIDSFAMNKIWEGIPPVMRKVDPSKYHLLLGAVNEHHHWTLVAIYPCEKRAIYLNPLGEVESQIKKCKEATRAFLRKKDVPISRWACSTVIHPKQQDSISCGVFVCKFADFILTEEAVDFPNSTEVINGYRREIAETLITESENTKDLCHICGERTSNAEVRGEAHEKWVACDACKLWFHWNCVDEKQRPVDVDKAQFLCNRCQKKLSST